MTDEQVARILGAAPALEGAHQQVARLARDSEQEADTDGGHPRELHVERAEGRAALDPVGHPRDSRDGTRDGTFPRLLGANARSERVTAEGALARRELPEEIRHRVAEPHARHHEDERVAVLESLPAAHHERVHAAPEPDVERGAELHHQPGEQVVDFHLRVGDSDIDSENHEERHAHHARHRREPEVAPLRKRPCERQREGRGKRKEPHVRPLVHLGCHARPFPGGNASEEAHQPDTAVVAEPQHEKHDRNGDKRRNQPLSQVTHATPSQISVPGS